MSNLDLAILRIRP